MSSRAGLSEPRLGIDIGRVIIAGPASRKEDTGFFSGDEAALLATPEMPGSFEAIARLMPMFGGRVWLVSKAGPRIQARTLRWLDGHDFAGRTGIGANRIRFCRERSDKQAICAELGLTHYVDDRPDIQASLDGIVAHRYLFGPQHGTVPDGTVHVLTWADAERVIRRSLTGQQAETGDGT